MDEHSHDMALQPSPTAIAMLITVAAKVSDPAWHPSQPSQQNEGARERGDIGIDNVRPQSSKEFPEPKGKQEGQPAGQHEPAIILDLIG
jgi:hypothetical protein